MGQAKETSVEEQRLSLKRRIEDFERSRRRSGAQREPASLSMRSEYNALSPQSRLPVELLSQIFVYHSTALMLPRGASQNRSCLERIRIPHVCHRWREIALGRGELWSNLLFVTPGIAELMLRWSKNAPLTITFNHSDDRWATPFFAIVATNLPRILSLEVSSIGGGARNREFLSLLMFPTPVLGRLVLRIREPGSLGPAQAFRLPDRFLRGHSGQLKHLEITGLELPDLDVLPPTLTHLQLGSEKLNTAMRPSLESILKALQRLPFLETLVLNHYTSDSGLSTFSGSAIDAPSLLDVTIRDSILTVERMLQHVRMPRAAVHLLLQDPLDNADDLRGLLSALVKSRRIRVPLALGELSVSETHSPTESLLLDFSFNFGGAEFGPGPPNICVGLPRPIRQNLTQLLSLFGESCVDMQSLCSLCVQIGKCGFSRREWVALGHLPSLSRVVFSHGAEAIDFCEALKVDTEQGHAPFVSLANLSLEGITLKQGSHVRDSLIAALKSRPKGRRVAKLEVTRSDDGFSETDIKFLEEAVPGMEVLWVRPVRRRNDLNDESEGGTKSTNQRRFHEPEDHLDD